MTQFRILVDGPNVNPPVNVQNGSRSMLVAVGAYLQAVASGIYTAKIRLNSGGTVATNAVTLSSHVNTNTVTVNGVALTCTNGVPTNVQYAVGATDEATSNALRATINACNSAKIKGIVYAYRKATFTLSSYVNTNTCTVNSVVFTGKTTPTAGVREEFAIGGTDTITAKNLAAAINNSISPRLAGIVSCTSAAAVVTIIYDGALTCANSANGTAASAITKIDFLFAGVVGNLGTLAISANGSVTGANFASGADGSDLTYGV